MPKYAIVPNRVILVAGESVTPEDQIGVVECDLPVHDVLALLQFRNASLVEIDDELNELEQDDIDEEGDNQLNGEPGTKNQEPSTLPFSSYSAKTQAALTKAGIATLPQAALWLRDNQAFTKLGIAKGVAAELVQQIEAAGIPTA